MITTLDVLLVEDDADTQANLIDILGLDGHRVRVAGTLAEVRKGGSRPEISLVILDRLLPDGTVEEWLPELRELLPRAEFIVITGYADMESTIVALKSGVTDYILKPIMPDALRRTVRRIAHQKQIERQLSQEQRFASQILETAEAIILVLDLQGRIIQFNPYFSRISGWKLDELRGKDWFTNCIPRQEIERIRNVFFRTASGIQNTDALSLIVTTDGKQRSIRWSNSTLKDENGEINSVLAVGVDVTDLMTAERVASQAQRLATIGETVAGLAHESRNALHRIQTNTELLKLDIPPESPLREPSEAIHRAALELHTALESVRQYAAPIQLAKEPALLSDIWRRTWGYLQSTREGRDAALIESIRGCDEMLNLDVIRIENVFRNLFENALASCADPVRISLNYDCQSAADVWLDVQDNGPGLCPEQRNRIFEPFYTTRTHGTGLGMAIVQRIIEAHGGEIRVADPQGGGARFLIRLPKLITPHSNLSLRDEVTSIE